MLFEDPWICLYKRCIYRAMTINKQNTTTAIHLLINVGFVSRSNLFVCCSFLYITVTEYTDTICLRHVRDSYFNNVLNMNKKNIDFRHVASL